MRVLVLSAVLAAAGAACFASTSQAADPLTPEELPLDHFNGMTGRLLFPEMTGAGGALVDYDGDGDLDAYLVQGALFPGSTMEEALVPFDGAGELRDVLLRNDGVGEAPIWVDVTEGAGITADGYGMVVATGDLDGDGNRDLFLGNYGANQLWRNRGDGTFEDWSWRLGAAAPTWTTSAAMIDYDGDGLEDLYVVNYVDYSVEDAPNCYAGSSRPDYCGPSGFASQPDQVLRNLGGGRFADVSAATGVGSVSGAGLGVALLDADGDGGLEVFVANDGQPNFLWRPGTDRWLDDGLFAGVAVNRRGEPEASMGTAVGDYDRDGDEDLFVTHLTGETNTLYVNSGSGLFDDRSSEAGMAETLPWTGFGVAWIDLDHDGWLDLAVANGAVRIQESSAALGEAYPLAQPNLLSANRQGRFVPIVDSAFGTSRRVSRGIARGDLDNDGDLDLLLTNNAGPARLFLGSASEPENWLGVGFSRPSCQPVTARYADGSEIAGRASTAGSYASASDPRVIFGGIEGPESLEIGTGDERLLLIDPRPGKYLRFE